MGLASGPRHQTAQGQPQIMSDFPISMYINTFKPGDTCQYTGSSMVQAIACRLFRAEPLPEPIMVDYQQGLALLTLSWDKNWDSYSLVNGYPSFYPRIALVAPSPGLLRNKLRIFVIISNLHSKKYICAVFKMATILFNLQYVHVNIRGQ